MLRLIALVLCLGCLFFAAPARSSGSSRSPQTVTMEVTGYCACVKCCGPNACGVTASGKPVSFNDGKFVAADRSLPFGTRLQVPGYAGGQIVTVQDRGGAIKGNKLDLYFKTHAEARKWGRQKVPVTLY